MIVRGWARGGALAGVLVGLLSGALTGCDTPPAPRAAPGPAPAPVVTPAVPDVMPEPEQSSATGARKQPSAEACPEGGVRLSEGGGDAAMGLRVESVRLVNCGAQPYVVDGYAEIRLLTGERARIDVTVAHGSADITSSLPSVDGPPGRVALAPGEAASLTLVWRMGVTGGSAGEGWVLAVSPRPGAPWLTLRLTRPVDVGPGGKLGLGPWRSTTG
ncbi:DUF4232 domain-containing protein [Streptomyces sp. NPDC002990]